MGYCWLSCYFESKNKQEVISKAFVGYGLRWRNEEVLRHIKMNNRLERVILQHCEVLKSMNALLCLVVSF